MLLDLTPKGRDENGPHHNLMDWCAAMTTTMTDRSITATNLPAPGGKPVFIVCPL